MIDDIIAGAIPDISLETCRAEVLRYIMRMDNWIESRRPVPLALEVLWQKSRKRHLEEMPKEK